MSDFSKYVEKVRDVGAALTRNEANAAVRGMLAGEAADEEIAALLTAIAKRGETVPELTGFAEALRQLAVPLPLTEAERAQLVDTCGTGGDEKGTFNISTGAALVAAAAGAKVAKHGNRARDLDMRIGGRARGARRRCRAAPQRSSGMSARDRLHLPLRAVVESVS